MLKTFVQKISGDGGLRIPQENCFQYVTAKEKEKISLQYFENHRAHLAKISKTSHAVFPIFFTSICNSRNTQEQVIFWEMFKVTYKCLLDVSLKKV